LFFELKISSITHNCFFDSRFNDSRNTNREVCQTSTSYCTI
jgi:hypothetical protein